MNMQETKTLLEKIELGYYTSEQCTAEENEEYKSRLEAGENIPDNVYEEGYFYRFSPAYSEDYSFNDFLLAKQTKFLKAIKNCIIFFTALVAGGIVINLLTPIFISLF